MTTKKDNYKVYVKIPDVDEMIELKGFSIDSLNLPSDEEIEKLKNNHKETLFDTYYIGIFNEIPKIQTNMCGNVIEQTLNFVEVSTDDTNYERVELSKDMLKYVYNDESNNNQTGYFTNKKEVLFNIPTKDWGTVAAIGIFTKKDGGDLLTYKKVFSDKKVYKGDGAPRLLPNQFKF